MGSGDRCEQCGGVCVCGNLWFLTCCPGSQEDNFPVAPALWLYRVRPAHVLNCLDSGESQPPSSDPPVPASSLRPQQSLSGPHCVFHLFAFSKV